MSSAIDTPGAVRLGSGRTSDVFAWSRGWVLKLFHHGLPRAHALRECAATRAVRATLGPVSFHVPEVGQAISLQGRVGLLYARADGVSLAAAYTRTDLQRFAQHIGERLAQLHLELHGSDSPRHAALDVLPDQRECFRQAITSTSTLPDRFRQPLLHVLEHVDSSACRLCHGDFHPHNILQDARGRATVIDWITAERGNPLGDVARTSVLLRYAPAGDATQIDAAQARLREAVERAYLNRYFGHDNASPRAPAEFEHWLTLAAAARLVEGIGAAERSGLLAFIARRLES